MFDVLDLGSKLLTILIISIALVLLWHFRSRVLLAVTGDDHIHGSALDLLWWGFFRCCGTCSGEWTRHVTSCPCIPKRFRSRNIVRMIGQFLGVASHTVELKNMVVGDLPARSAADFYLEVDAASNPTMKTSSVEQHDPKVVHFPETLTVRLKKSAFEKQVVVRVCQLNIVGQKVLCELRLNATSVLDWSTDPSHQIKRFVMHPIDRTLELETPPWILVQFDQPTDARELESLHDPNIVRTINADQTTTRDFTIKEFKRDYQLVDTSGNAISEVNEGDLMSVASYRRTLQGCVNFFGCMVFLGVPSYLLFRFYIWSCYRHFTWLTIAELNNTTFPISTASLAKLVHDCEDKYLGTGLTGIPCNPSEEQTLRVCHRPPSLQPRPTAFTVAVHEHFGVDISGVACFHGVCALRNKLTEWDWTIFLLCFLLIILVYVCRGTASASVRKMRSDINRQRAQELSDMQAHLTNQSRQAPVRREHSVIC